ncbi:AraC family transcriptional regulator [Chitinophaga parva]|uniref:AraC family transcriptional regulator n=1 Tax=Chitinophaga parva TaxID=2169414 RepID=A0A2T7BLL1_9BACT|nr:helix-turn-helix transcriptional regulator [Chitinophaga parva]PUZ28520.1 AraC family transcriptional regulator [Chitinophaga parva]
MANTKTIRIKTISEFHELRGLPKPEHPLISMVDYRDIHRPANIGDTNWILDFYQISLKHGIGAKLKYGQQQYDFDEGVMFFIAPHQVFRIDPDGDEPSKRSGWMLLVHPDFLWGTSLAKGIHQYEFFGYAVNEALFLSDREEKTMHGIVQNIKQEYHSNIDKFTQGIIISQIESLLNYSERFYHRQFITRKITNHQLLDKLETLLNEYFSSGQLSAKGLPTVQYLADGLYVSPKYLTGLLKVLTGQTAQQHLHEKLIARAKEMLSTTPLSVSEIAYELGFEHTQSFSRFFKTKTNITPVQFRQSFNNN